MPFGPTCTVCSKDLSECTCAAKEQPAMGWVSHPTATDGPMFTEFKSCEHTAPLDFFEWNNTLIRYDDVARVTLEDGTITIVCDGGFTTTKRYTTVRAAKLRFHQLKKLLNG